MPSVSYCDSRPSSSAAKVVSVGTEPFQLADQGLDLGQGVDLRSGQQALAQGFGQTHRFDVGALSGGT